MSNTGSKSVVALGPKHSSRDDGDLSKALVPRGSKGSQPHQSTSRALVLRAGTWGKGELATTRKISGQDKLNLLAGEMMRTAIRAPFRMEELLKIAESQLGVHLDEISNLKDPDFFYDDILATINSRTESIPDTNGKRSPPLHDPAWVAWVVGTRIHNVYTLAGSWRIIRDILKRLQAMGMGDTDVRGQLRNSERLRTQYLVLYDMATTLAHLGRQRVANNAASTPHYAPYFVHREKGDSGEPEMEFDQRGNNRRKIREAHKSYIDSIILELVLPDSQYPPYVLMSCLHGAVDECRQEEGRFTQALWDAVGDLSVTIQLLDLLESPLFGPEGDSWAQHTVHLDKQFTQFLAAQACSAQVCTMVDFWRPYLRPPLTDTKRPHVLAQLWNGINRAYRQVSGVDIDSLWSLQDDLNRVPQWSTYYIPGLAGDERFDPDNRALALHKTSKRKNHFLTRKPRKEITLGGGDNSDYAAMPGLLSGSDSSADVGDSSGSTTGDDLSSGDCESEYDPEEDEWLQDMLQDALNATYDVDDLPGPAHFTFDIDEDKVSDNPFKRMFSRLKDRVFSANPILKAGEQSRRPFKPRPGTVPPPTTATPKGLDTSTAEPSAYGHVKVDGIDIHSRQPTTLPDVKSLPSQGKRPGKSIPIYLESEEELPPLVPPGNAAETNKIITEGVENEENMDESKKKKKKKKKSKKSLNVAMLSPTVDTHQQSSPSPPSPSNKSKGSFAKQFPQQPFVQNSIDPLGANFLRTSLPLAQEITPQSGRSYLQSENITIEKTKVKSRPAFAGSFFKTDKGIKNPQSGEEDGKGFLGRMKKLHLPKRAGDLFSRLINPADGKTHAKKPMKWDEFLKLMRLMGFSCDPSTAGSSVRFDPPNPRDPSITFHKPHPDPTLQRGHLRDFGKRLKKAYGWSPEQFKHFVGEDDDDE